MMVKRMVIALMTTTINTMVMKTTTTKITMIKTTTMKMTTPTNYKSFCFIFDNDPHVCFGGVFTN